MSGNQDVNKLLILGQLLEYLGREMGAPVRDKELQLGWEQYTQGFNHCFGGDMGASHKERESQTLPGAVVGNEQDGNPGSNHSGSLQPLSYFASSLPPLLVFLFSLRQLLPPPLPFVPPSRAPGLLAAVLVQRQMDTGPQKRENFIVEEPPHFPAKIAGVVGEPPPVFVAVL